jgi:8-oxo-dGTP pyrophosphatase MutT (NUDIX family)
VPADTSNPLTVLSSTRIYENEKIAFVDHYVRDPSGREHRYPIVHLKEPGVRILPIDREGCTFLVGQYRFGGGYYSWELPAGGRSLEEAPLSGAMRELEEEAGLAAGRWLELFHFVSAGSITDEAPVAFLAWDLEPRERRPDDSEVLEIRRVPFGEALAMALRGEIRDTASVATLLGAHVRALRGELPDEVAPRLR